jgi:hypothetical protein
VDRGLHNGLHPLTELRNPFKNEADAFRLLLIVGIAAVAVIAVSVLVNTTAAALLGLILLLVGGSMALKWLRLQLEAPDAEDADEDV